MSSWVQIPAEMKTLMSYLVLAGGGNKYPVELVKMHASLVGPHIYQKENAACLRWCGVMSHHSSSNTTVWTRAQHPCDAMCMLTHAPP